MSPDPFHALRDALALGHDDLLEVVATETAPVPAQHVKGAAPVPLATLLASRPTPVQVRPDGPVVVHQYVGHPGVLVVDRVGALTPLFGETVDDDDALVLDGRARPAAVLVTGRDGEHVVLADGARATLLEVTRATPPTTAEVLGAATVEPSLADRLAELAASGRALDRVAALGTVQRLWTPTGKDARLAALRGERGPADAVRAWAAALGPARLAEIERRAGIEIADLRRRVVELDPDGDEATLARALVDRRDALESVLAVLAVAGAHERTLSLLEALDAEAVAAGTELPPAGVLGELPWLAEVAVAQPGAWWTTFAEI